MAFATNNNTRVFYATQAVAIGKIGATAIADSAANGSTLAGEMALCHGVQSFGADTNFNLEQAFELGQLSLYENIEEIPDVNVTMQKVLDGYSLLYHLGSSYDGTGTKITTTTLSGRADTRADLRAVINATTDSAVTSGDSAVAELYCSGMYLSSVSYNIPTDGNATEDVSFVGNNKRWIESHDAVNQLLIAVNDDRVDDTFAAIFGDDTPVTPNASIIRRQDVVTSGTSINGYTTILPSLITGVNAEAGSVFKSRAPQNAGRLDPNRAHIQSFTCSVDLGRTPINQLGTRAPYSRYVDFPTEVTSSLEVVAIAGDNITAVETTRNNLSNHEICVVLNDSTVIHLGKKNKVSSATYGGGDAGGGNASITYNFSNFNDFVVLHSGDPVSADANYWDDQFAS